LLFLEGPSPLKTLKKWEEELNRFRSERIKIVEEGGIKISKLLTKLGWFQEPKSKNCIVQTQADGTLRRGYRSVNENHQAGQ
jgi:hypothetical protein